MKIIKKININFKLILIIGLFLFTSCANKVKIQETALSKYKEAKTLLDNKNYVQAAEKFLKIEEDFPFSSLTEKAKVMAIYAYYKENDTEKTLNTIEEFILSSQNEEYLDYVLYIRSLVHFHQIPNVKRAQDNTKEASYSFRELVARFPTSIYASDAKEKISIIDEQLAGYHLNLARSQMNKNNYIGAINNIDVLISRYHHTNQIYEAYYRLIEIYYKLGLDDRAFECFEILKNANARDSKQDEIFNKWLDKSANLINKIKKL